MIFRLPALFLMLLILPLAAGTSEETERALAQARESVAKDPRSSQAHVKLAIALGKRTDFVDSRTKMELAREIGREAETSLRLDPANDLACLILAKWHDGMASLNPIFRGIATALYGKMPPASLAQAEEYFRKAVSLKPENVAYRAELATFLDRAGRTAEARAEWRKVAALPPRDAEDRVFLETAHRRVADR